MTLSGKRKVVGEVYMVSDEEIMALVEIEAEHAHGALDAPVE